MGHSFVLAGLIQGDRFWETEYDRDLETETSVPRWKRRAAASEESGADEEKGK